MTNNEVIIDGVDVSRCKYYGNYCFGGDGCLAEKDVYGEITYRCAEEDMENCYYKQLQRKTTECENNLTAYKNELAIYDIEREKLIAEIDDLLIKNENKTAEYEKLKY